MKALACAAALLLAAATAEAATFQVTNVMRGDTLKLRIAPNPHAASAGDLAPNATGIAVVAVDSKSSDWVKVTRGRLSGWVNARYLAYESGLPARLSCHGTEPFWGIEIGPGNAAMDFSPMDGGKARYGFGDPVSSRGHAFPWLLPLGDKGSGVLIVDKRICSDGMSDTRFPYAIVASVGGRFVDGCCK